MHKSTFLLLVTSLLLFASIPASASVFNLKLNDPIDILGDSIVGFKISADGQYAVYTANHERQEVRELYAVPTAGGTPVKLNGPINEASNYLLNSFTISPDSSYVVFVASIVGEPDSQLYTVPITGGPATRISPGTDGVFNHFTISSDGQHVVFYQGPTFGGGGIFYRHDMADGNQAVLIDFAGSTGYVSDYLITPDNSHIVLRTNSGALSSMPLVGGDLTSMSPASFVSDYALAGDNRVVFLRHVGSGRYDLYSNALTGDDRIKLNDELVTFGSVESFSVSPTTNRVTYVADQDIYNQFELFSTTTLGGPSTKLQADPAGISRRTSYDPSFTPDGTTILYEYGPHLYAVAAEGGVPLTLSPTVTYADAYTGARLVTPDGNSVIFAMEVEDNQLNLYESSLTTGAPTALLSTPFESFIGPGLQKMALLGGSDVIFTARLDSDAFELYQVALAGGPVTKISGPTQPDYGVGNNFVVSNDGLSVFYQADQDHPDFIGLYKTTLGTVRSSTIQRLDLPLAEMTDVLDFSVSPDETHVVYRGALEILDSAELFVVPIAGGGATKLNGPLTDSGNVARDYLISSTNTHVVYKADQRVKDRFELFSVPLTGGPATMLNTPLLGRRDVTQFTITSDGASVLYLADQAVTDVTELFKVPIEGGTPVRINHMLPSGTTLDTYDPILVSPDGNYVTYQASGSSSVESYIAPLNGGTPVLANDGVRVASSQFLNFSADSAHLLYLGLPIGESFFQVFQVPISGGTPLAMTPDATSIIDYELTATRIIYLERDTDVLASIPIAGGTAQTLATNVDHFTADINSERVVFYETNLGARSDKQLFSILSDGSDRQTLLEAPYSSFDQSDYKIFGSHVLITNGPNNAAELLSVPLSGGTPVSLSGSLPDGHGILAYSVSSDDSFVGITGRIDSAETWENYIAPIAGGPVQKINKPPASTYGVNTRPYVCNGGACAIVHGALDKQDVIELYAWFLNTPTAVTLASSATTPPGTVALSLLLFTCLLTGAVLSRRKQAA